VVDRLRTADYLRTPHRRCLVLATSSRSRCSWGPAGVRKTELAKAIAEITAVRLIRLQCYEGLDERSLYQWNYKKQLLRIPGDREHEGDGRRSSPDIFSEAFLLTPPGSRAIRADEPIVS